MNFSWILSDFMKMRKVTTVSDLPYIFVIIDLCSEFQLGSSPCEKEKKTRNCQDKS